MKQPMKVSRSSVIFERERLAFGDFFLGGLGASVLIDVFSDTFAAHVAVSLAVFIPIVLPVWVET